MKVARVPSELERQPRAIAIGTFDGVHLGHRAVVEAMRAAGPLATVVTFDPHPREVLGGQVVALATLERRLELLADLGVEETLVVPFTREVAALEAEAFVDQYLRSIGAEVVVAGDAFRFGRERRGDFALLEQLGIRAEIVPLVEGISSSRIRTLVAAGEVRAAAPLLGRPVEVEGMVVSGDARGEWLGFPTANIEPEARLLVPSYGIYAGATRGHRVAMSIGVNPHYGAGEQRLEAFLLDFEGDLYGERLVVELWERLRDEASFGSEAELVAQIGRDVEQARAAVRP